MTRKPRSESKDYTRAKRCARRNAILNAAAERMGFGSWSAFETNIREALECAASDNGAALRLKTVLVNSANRIDNGPGDLPPADIQAIYEQYPAAKPAHVAGVRGSVSTREK